MPTYLPQNLISLANNTGRWFLKKISNQNTLYTTNLGSYLRFRTSSAHELSITTLANQNPLSPAQMFAIRIDQHNWQRYPAGLPIKINLSASNHFCEIMTAGNTDLDQVWTGDQGFAIRAIKLDQGQLIPTAPRPVIDFIGDSITAGCWVAGRHASYDYRPESNYIATCCDDLNVDSVRIAYSAGGVLRLATGGVPTANEFLTHLDAATSWQPNSPQLVVINLGVNDRRYPISQFITAYSHFLATVRNTFPATQLASMIPFSQTFAAEIRQLTKQYHIPVIETKGWCQSFTDGLHPDQAGAIESGHRLATVLQPFLS